MLEVITPFLLSINLGSGSRILMGQAGNTPPPTAVFIPKKITNEENIHPSLNNVGHPAIDNM
eukprot:13320131-Ditylum_brightwellii.AAC.1